MKTFRIALIVLLVGVVAAATACAQATTPTPRATLTPGAPITPEPTPGRLEVFFVESALAPQEAEWMDIPTWDGKESKSGLELNLGEYRVYLHASNDPTFNSQHLHVYKGDDEYVTFVSLYHSKTRAVGDEYTVTKGMEYIPVKIAQGLVLHVGIVGGMKLNFRRVGSTDQWQVAIPRSR